MTTTRDLLGYTMDISGYSTHGLNSFRNDFDNTYGSGAFDKWKKDVSFKTSIDVVGRPEYDKIDAKDTEARFNYTYDYLQSLANTSQSRDFIFGTLGGSAKNSQIIKGVESSSFTDANQDGRGSVFSYGTGSVSKKRRAKLLTSDAGVTNTVFGN